MITINILVLALILIAEAIIFTFIGMALMAWKAYEDQRMVAKYLIHERNLKELNEELNNRKKEEES